MPYNKDKESNQKPHVQIGTIGHVDHGKTTLTAAIIGYLKIADTSQIQSVIDDKMKETNEESLKGITLKKQYRHK